MYLKDAAERKGDVDFRADACVLSWLSWASHAATGNIEAPFVHWQQVTCQEGLIWVKLAYPCLQHLFATYRCRETSRLGEHTRKRHSRQTELRCSAPGTFHAGNLRTTPQLRCMQNSKEGKR